MNEELSNKEDNEKEPRDRIILRDYEDLINNNKLNFLPSDDPTATLKNLSRPRFLGSYHLRESIENPKYKQIQNLLKGNLELKYAKSFRSLLFNPLTIALIIIALAFNLLWLFLMFT